MYPVTSQTTPFRLIQADYFVLCLLNSYGEINLFQFNAFFSDSFMNACCGAPQRPAFEGTDGLPELPNRGLSGQLISTFQSYFDMYIIIQVRLMQGNKICVTQKGLDYLKDGKKQYENIGLNKKNRGQTSSLPLISNMGQSRSTTLNEKKKTSHQLCKLTLQLQKMQKIGVKKLMLNQEDKKLEEILNKQTKQKNNRYLRTLIPHIIRKTRDNSKVNNLNSRYNRSIAYTERLLQNHDFHSKYGVTNHIKVGKKEDDK